MNLTLGPIIGKVTSTSARILAESDTKTDLTVEIKSAGSVVASQTRTVAAGWIAAFAFEGLSPQTKYTVDVSGAGSIYSGSFRTFPEEPSSLRIGVVSCNKDPYQGPWARIHQEVQNLDLLVHAGDQVYLDFDTALETWKTGGPSAPGKVLEFFRNHYRDRWALGETRGVLAKVPNLAIWDDHEVRDGFGTRREDSDRKSPEYQVALLARQVYREYQHALFGTPLSPGPLPGFEYHSHAFGPIGLVFLDNRSARTFSLDPELPYIGKLQWERLQRDLEKDDLATIRALLVVSPTAPVLLNTVTSSVLSLIEKSLRDQWAYAPHQTEQRMMLELLREFKSSGQREVFVVAGDLHIGIEKTRIRHGKVEFHQMISSGINNLTEKGYKLVKFALAADRYPIWGFWPRHSGIQQPKNFGIIHVDVPAIGRPTIAGNLVTVK